MLLRFPVAFGIACLVIWGRCLTGYEINVVGLPFKENEQKLEVKSGNTNEVFATTCVYILALI
ncbi:hypothetical protein ALC57_15541 [Trachymyrmex cornetzi]|uniref:Uncharacterized protein n=1 Tax=Trachymyrmex cornetzi TaxID=471704 RepID=A0A151IWX9_9HYME|nr:hypothetical protein ALC57_15541 [Trachymyrmex cornetzi]